MKDIRCLDLANELLGGFWTWLQISQCGSGINGWNFIEWLTTNTIIQLENVLNFQPQSLQGVKLFCEFNESFKIMFLNGFFPWLIEWRILEHQLACLHKFYQMTMRTSPTWFDLIFFLIGNLKSLEQSYNLRTYFQRMFLQKKYFTSSLFLWHSRDPHYLCMETMRIIPPFFSNAFHLGPILMETSTQCLQNRPFWAGKWNSLDFSGEILGPTIIFQSYQFQYFW